LTIKLPSLSFGLKSKIFQDCFSSKYITIIVYDESDSFHVFPLRNDYIIDSKFFVRIHDQIYPFLIDSQYIKTYRSKSVSPVRVINYTTRDYRPLDLAEIYDVEKFCEQNNVNEIDESVAKVIIGINTLLKSNTDPAHMITIDDLLNFYLGDIKDKESEEYKKEYRSLMLGYQKIGTDNIRGPTDPVSRFLGKKIHGNPISISNLLMTLRHMDYEWKRISNPAKGPFKHWLLLFAIIGIVSAIGIVAYFVMGGPSEADSIYDAISRLDQAGVEAPAELTPAQELFNEEIVGEQTDTFDAVNDLVGNVLNSEDLIAPDVRPDEGGDG